MKINFIFTSILAIAVIMLAGCAVPGNSALIEESTGFLQIRVTDMPPDLNVTAINVELSNVEVHKAGDESGDNGRWIPVEMTEQPFEVNLIELQMSDIEKVLSEEEITTGHYTQIRMDVALQSIEIDEEEVEDVDFVLPGGKLKIVGSFEIGEGQETELVLDFLADKSLVVTGQGKLVFKPVVHMKVSGPTHPAKLEAALEVSEMDNEPTATAELSTEESHRGKDSVYLVTTGTVETGDEARIVITPPAGTTLGDIESISWWEFLRVGYPPHVDILLDVDDDGTYTGYPYDDTLVFEYAYNTTNHYDEGGTAYHALTGDWYQVFSDDSSGPSQVDDAASAWSGSGPAGPPTDIELHTLASWKVGVTYTTDATKTINADTPIVVIIIEIDNWIVQTDAYVDDVEVVINGVTYKVLL